MKKNGTERKMGPDGKVIEAIEQRYSNERTKKVVLPADIEEGEDELSRSYGFYTWASTIDETNENLHDMAKSAFAIIVNNDCENPALITYSRSKMEEIGGGQVETRTGRNIQKRTSWNCSS